MSFNIWTPYGLMNVLTGNSDLSSRSNPNVIYEGSPQILAGPNVFKMWCSTGGGATGIYYYESADGITSWTPHPSNPIVASAAGIAFPTLYKVGSTYYLYTGPFSGSGDIGVQTSADGITFGAKSVAIATSGAGIEATGIAQLNLVPGTPGFGTGTGETYYAYYEAVGGGNSYEVLVTSTDLLSWTRPNGLTPTFSGVAPMTFQKIGSKYYTWAPDSAIPSSLAAQGLAFNALARWSATSPSGPWTQLLLPGTLTAAAVLYHTQRNEFDISGNNTPSSATNLGDPYIISALGNMYAYWTRTTINGGQNALCMAVAASCTPAQQVAGYEGMVNFPIPMSNMNLNVLGSDDFQRANANPIGGNWSTWNTGTDSQLTSHLMAPGAIGGNGISYYNTPSFPNDQWSRVTHQSASGAGLTGCILHSATDGSSNMYWGYWTGVTGSNGTVIIGKHVAGVGTTIGSYSPLKMSLGDTLTYVIVGSKLLVYYNGFPIMAVTDAALASGPPGVRLYADAALSAGEINAWSGGGFQTGYSVSGNAGVAGATVTYAGSLLAGTVTADGSGDYAITGLIADTYTVTASKNGYSFAPSSLSEAVTVASITGADFTATLNVATSSPGFGINNGIVQRIAPGINN